MSPCEDKRLDNKDFAYRRSISACEQCLFRDGLWIFKLKFFSLKGGDCVSIARCEKCLVLGVVEVEVVSVAEN